jgi:hypothetical protein
MLQLSRAEAEGFYGAQGRPFSATGELRYPARSWSGTEGEGAVAKSELRAQPILRKLTRNYPSRPCRVDRCECRMARCAGDGGSGNAYFFPSLNSTAGDFQCHAKQTDATHGSRGAAADPRVISFAQHDCQST